MKRAVITTVLALVFGSSTFGQSQKYLNEGTTFGKSIAPTRPGEVVNPASVNSSAWSGNTSNTSTVPSGLGGFSNPITSDEYIRFCENNGVGGPRQSSNGQIARPTHPDLATLLVTKSVQQ